MFVTTFTWKTTLMRLTGIHTVTEVVEISIRMKDQRNIQQVWRPSQMSSISEQTPKVCCRAVVFQTSPLSVAESSEAGGGAGMDLFFRSNQIAQWTKAETNQLSFLTSFESFQYHNNSASQLCVLYWKWRGK